MWQVKDPVDGESWSAAQLDRVWRLLPHVRQTVSVRQTLAGAGALGATLTEMLDATGLGIIQLDGRGRNVEANDRARDLLRAGDRLLDKNDLLSARWPQDNDELQKLLSRPLPPFGVQGAGGSMVVRRSGALPPLALHPNPVGSQETGHPFRRSRRWCWSTTRQPGPISTLPWQQGSLASRRWRAGWRCSWPGA